MCGQVRGVGRQHDMSARGLDADALLEWPHLDGNPRCDLVVSVVERHAHEHSTIATRRRPERIRMRVAHIAASRVGDFGVLT